MKKEIDIYAIPHNKIHSGFIGEIRKQWFRSAHYKACLNRIISEKKGVRGGSRRDCVVCGVDITPSKASVDHIDPVTPIHMTQKELGYEKIKERMWCNIENTQIMCKECHKKKTAEERAERRNYQNGKGIIK